LGGNYPKSFGLKRSFVKSIPEAEQVDPDGDEKVPEAVVQSDRIFHPEDASVSDDHHGRQKEQDLREQTGPGVDFMKPFRPKFTDYNLKRSNANSNLLFL
jgi:hypothetical protein